jgi:hypothetical protein
MRVGFPLLCFVSTLITVLSTQQPSAAQALENVRSLRGAETLEPTPVVSARAVSKGVTKAFEDNAARCVAPLVEHSPIDQQLSRGEVVVDLVEEKKVKFVVARIKIDQPPALVWPVLVNPYEFKGRICPRMKSLDVLLDRIDISILKCSINVCILIPSITYVVESKYRACEEVEFKRIGGNLKEFSGSWLLRPLNSGKSTEVLYAMYVDPGIPVPRWIVREGVKAELPRTLIALRQRVDDVYKSGAKRVPETIRAANPTQLAQAQLVH